MNNPQYTIPDFLLDWPRTRIVCTIGPATASKDTIITMVRSGMAVARINLSHGSAEQHREYISTVREASSELGCHIGILMDLPGPKYRTDLGDDSSAQRSFAAGETVSITARDDGGGDGGQHALGVWPSGLHRDAKVGGQVLVDDGAATLEVTAIEGRRVDCRLVEDGVIKNNKTISLPGTRLSLDYFTPETVDGLELASELEVDFVGLSCIQSAEDVRATRRWLEEKGVRISLMSKIEMACVLEELEEVVDASDAVMVARGDLGIELPLAELPGVQARIIRLANQKGKPVVTATQMLESMITNPRPTRAEVTDINSAVTDGTDATMLSGETAVGKYPTQAVQFMADIAIRSEQDGVNQHRNWWESGEQSHLGVDEIIAHSACKVADQVNAVLIVAFTESGASAIRVSNYRPAVPVVAMVRSPRAIRTLTVRRGVIPILVEPIGSSDMMFRTASRMARENGYAKLGDLIVVVMGLPIGQAGATNLLRVLRIREPRDTPLS